MTNWFWHRASGGRLLAYLEGALRPEQRVRLEKHLPRCAACRRELEHLRETQSAILGAREAFPVAVPQGDLWARVSERLGPAQPAPRVSGRPFLRVSAVAAAAAMLVIGVRLAQGPAAQRATQVARAVPSGAPQPSRQGDAAKAKVGLAVKPRPIRADQGVRSPLSPAPEAKGRVWVAARPRRLPSARVPARREARLRRQRRVHPSTEIRDTSAMLARLPEDIKLDLRQTPKGAATDGDHLSGIVSARNVLNTSPEAVNRSFGSGAYGSGSGGEGISDLSSIAPPVAAKPAPASPASPATSLGVLGAITQGRERVGGVSLSRDKATGFSYEAKGPSGARLSMGGAATSGTAPEASPKRVPERESSDPFTAYVAVPSFKMEVKRDAPARPAGPQPRSVGAAGALSEEVVKAKDSAVALKTADAVSVTPRLDISNRASTQAPPGDRQDLRQQVAKGQQLTVDSLVAEGRAFLLKGLWAKAKAAFSAALVRDPGCQAAKDGLKAAERLGQSRVQTQSRQQSQTQKPQPRRR